MIGSCSVPSIKFIEFSKNIGQQVLLVQGAGGNTSIKEGDTLWVKASGKWLSRAGEENMFIPLPLNYFKDSSLENSAAEGSDKKAWHGLQPSIEASLHALLPHKVVAHVHSINTLAVGVRADGRDILQDRLGGIRWDWVPYVKPGQSLADSIEKTLVNRPDVLVLANHGLIVGGASCHQTIELLDEVERRLRQVPRAQPGFDQGMLYSLAESVGMRLPRYNEIHNIATDPSSYSMALGGALYPDHIVFLGAMLRFVKASEDPRQGLARITSALGKQPPYVLLEGIGVLVDAAITAGAEEMLLCQALLLQMIDEDVDLVYLSDTQAAELLDWDAEKIRQSLDMGDRATPDLQ